MKKPKRPRRKRQAPRGESADGLHGQWNLPAIALTSYNLEVKGRYGFIGDQASGRAFRKRLQALARVAKGGQMEGEDSIPTPRTKKKHLDRILAEGAPIAGAVVHSAVEEFAQALAEVIRRYLKQAAWRRVERIVVGGGLSDSRVGELAIGRAAILLHGAGTKVDLMPIGHHPDEAGLMGCVHLVPTGILKGFDSMLAVDIGGTNLRCGIVAFKAGRGGTPTEIGVERSLAWRHRDDRPTRDQLVKRLVVLLRRLEKAARKSGRKLAPVIGVGCPGIINPDGTIQRGTQNLPGNWQGKGFNLPLALKARQPRTGGHDTLVVLHNDAVAQGLSSLPDMRKIDAWAVLTIGTGLGNASFRRPARRSRRAS